MPLSVHTPPLPSSYKRGSTPTTQITSWPSVPALSSSGPLIFRDNIQQHLGGKPLVVGIGIDRRVVDRAVDDAEAHILLAAGAGGVGVVGKLDVMQADKVADGGDRRRTAGDSTDLLFGILIKQDDIGLLGLRLIVRNIEGRIAGHTL